MKKRPATKFKLNTVPMEDTEMMDISLLIWQVLLGCMMLMSVWLRDIYLAIGAVTMSIQWAVLMWVVKK